MTWHAEPAWLLITGGDVVLPDGDVLSGGCVVVQDGIIQEVTSAPPASLLLNTQNVQVVDVTGQWVTAGLVDQHLHGAFGADFNQSNTEAIRAMLKALPQYGITAILPTLMTAPKLDMVLALTQLEDMLQNPSPQEARMMGIHLEGPFLHPDYRGAHPKEDLLTPTETNFQGLIAPSVRRVTLAPDLPDALSAIASLVADNIQCSVGHTGASFEVAQAAFEAGATCATHLYNAMTPFTHRAPGIVGAALLNDNITVELITDGLHLSPQTVALTLKTKPIDKCVVISDCNALTGMTIGQTIQFGKQVVTLSANGPRNQQDRLAGSASLITDCIRNVVQWGLLPFEQAILLATQNPARYLGENELVGGLFAGALADIVVWQKSDLSLAHVFLGGEAVQLPQTPYPAAYQAQ